MKRRAPRPLGKALETVMDRAEPETLLAAVQRAWAPALGDAIAAECEPVSERAGEVLVRCRSSSWAAELEMMQLDLVGRLNEVLGDGRPASLRFVATGTSSRPRR